MTSTGDTNLNLEFAQNTSSTDFNNLVELKTKRGQIKARLTRLKTYFESRHERNIDIKQLKLRLAKFETTCWDDFNHVQSKIEQFDQSDTQSDERDFFENSYFELVSTIQSYIEAHTESSIENTSNHFQTSLQHSRVRLPLIQIQPFDGNYEHWLTFYDMFSSLIDSDESLSEIQKFHYLRSLLRGEAFNLIQSIETSAQNYQIAWNMLVERYQNKRIIIQKHISALFNLNSISKESASELRQLTDDVVKHTGILKTLGVSIEYCDLFVIHLITQKLDSGTTRSWESHIQTTKQSELPTLNDLLSFLKQRCQLLEMIQANKLHNTPSFTNSKSKVTRTLIAVKGQACSYCKGTHRIYNCNSFSDLTPLSRLKHAQVSNLCINCLRPGHAAKTCTSGTCRTCHKKHHTLLHLGNTLNTNEAPTVKPRSDEEQNTPSNLQTSSVVTHSSFNDSISSNIILGTAVVFLLDNHGNRHKCRALLDSGSQSNFISQRLCNLLKLPTSKVQFSITGINQIVSSTSYKASVTLQSCNTSFKANITCLVLPVISENLPITSFDKSQIDFPNGIVLADPDFNKSAPIDLLLGASIFFELLCVGQTRSKTGPILQKTRLGWILSGPIPHCDSNHYNSYFATQSNNLDETIRKFWEIEDCSVNLPSKQTEHICETNFKATTTRQNDGRFIVHLPLVKDQSLLGESRTTALRRFYALERKLSTNSELQRQYSEFMQEYLNLKHMIEVSETDAVEQLYYLPHHCVVKEFSTTTKLRVVFDASCKTSSGISLNDIQAIGPTIQDDLFSILLRFRKHTYTLTGDIAKMYRQVLVDPKQCSLQRIFWRFDKSKPISTYELRTVTYGTAAAPFLAIRCLHELAYQHATKHPLASSIILKDFYVDDLITGSNSIDELKNIQSTIVEILKAGQFELRKWSSNTPEVLDSVSADLVSSDPKHISDNSTIKTLGVLWHPTSDTFKYSIKSFDKDKSIVTKRSILSHVSQIFDPLGLLGPVIVLAKILIQKLWQARVDWDEPAPPEITNKWSHLQDELPSLNTLTVARHCISSNAIKIELHAFSDACETSYGSCVYIRSKDPDGKYHVHILTAKSRVAPTKILTIPRLELCGAYLMVQLVQKVRNSLALNFDCTYYWCDSSVVLAWIKTPSNQLKTFVSNRVAQIQAVSDPEQWHYVPSAENPADIISRGCSPSKLVNSNLWWNGPPWLLSDFTDWSSMQSTDDISQVHSEMTRTSTSLVTNTLDTLGIFSKYSSFLKLQHVVAYAIRFKHNTFKSGKLRNSGSLTTEELDNALNILVKLSQKISFPTEYHALSKSISLPKSSRLLCLNPFLDQNGIIRVGGRLSKATFTSDKKHPMVLSNKHELTTLLIQYEHERLLHAGPNQVLASLRDRFWPISGRDVTRKVTRKCIKCFRVRPTPYYHIMGELPSSRVTPTRPFSISGVDYAGPINLKEATTRNSKIVKAYICIFVCFSTKAVHIELVGSLTTDAFLAALRRFASRRGMPHQIYSDNGKNFVGAQAELAKFLNNQKQKIISSTSDQGITWNFIPPHAPHFGGLWEAGVKSIKTHLNRVISNRHLNFEQMNTLLAQIEACLNSRPLHPLSDDPNDLSPLTPAHFLVGTSLTSIPEQNLLNVPENRLRHFKAIQQMLQHFWTRWAKEYISELQQRSKWKTNNTTHLKVGDLAVLKEDGLPPMNWKLGRITKLYPGSDNVVRAVDIKTVTGTYRRPTIKLCPLPIC